MIGISNSKWAGDQWIRRVEELESLKILKPPERINPGNR
jgi:hypothetical protein